MALRVARAHAAPLSVLAGATAVVTASAALGAALAVTGADLLVLLPSGVVGLVAVWVLALDLAWRRQHELALARRRGVRGGSAVRVATAPALGAVAAGGLLGLAAAVAVTGLAAGGWGLPERLGPGELLVAGCALAAVAAVAAVAGVVVLRVSVVASPSGPRRRPAVGPAVLPSVAGPALVVAAAAVLYRSSPGAGPASPSVLAGSAVVGLAAGQLVAWAARGLGTVTARGRSTSVVLALRRASSRYDDGRLRVVVAAAVVVVATWSAAHAASSWAREADLLRVAAPVQVELPGTSALDAWRLTRELDPQGRWLMAGAVIDDRAEATLRAAYLDLERYDRVSGATLEDTPGGLSSVGARLRDAPGVRVVRGARLDAAASYAGARPGSLPRRFELTVDYLADGGAVASEQVVLRSDGPATWSAQAPLPSCARACVLLGVAIDPGRTGGTRGTGAPRTDLRLDRLTLDGTDLVGDGLARDGARAPAEAAPALRVGSSYQPLALVVEQPVVVAGDPQWDDGAPRAPGIAGRPRAAVEVGARSALPLVGAAGVVGDLPVALAGSRGSVVGVRSVVLARSDTPEQLMTALAAAGAEPPLTLDPAGRVVLGPAATARRHLRQLVALASAALGLLCLAGAAPALAGESRRDRAALRVVGVGGAVHRRAALVESALVGLGAAAASALGGWLAVEVVTGATALTPVGPTLLPPPDVTDVPVLLAVVTVVAGAVVALVLLTRRSGGRLGTEEHAAGVGAPGAAP